MRQKLPSGGRDWQAVEVIDAGMVRRRVMRVAARQHGVITHNQLVGLGLSAYQVTRWVRAGWLRRLHRGVYLVGAVAPERAHEHAAVLACGRDAYASHHTAATLYHLPLSAPAGSIHVTVVNRDVRRPGITIHRTGALCRDEIRTFDGIPITSPARTIVDLAAHLAPADLEHVLAQAYGKNLATRDRVLAVVAHRPKRSGTRTLRRLLEPGAGPAFTRSPPERQFLALMRKARLPNPRVNARVHGHEVDFVWPKEGLVVEVEGHAFHAARPQRERDSARDQTLTARGFRVLRITPYHIAREPEALLARVAESLASARRESR